jgi:hypothetical protein
MKEILERVYSKKIKSIQFDQDISISIEQDDDNYINETSIDSEEPCYIIYFEDGTITEIKLSELIVKIFSLKDKL